MPNKKPSKRKTSKKLIKKHMDSKCQLIPPARSSNKCIS